MTEVVNLVEDILSDEYEEGEILDEDILYENVSSLEEFSDPEDKKLGNKWVKSDGKKCNNRRKKEHKCKNDSVCRTERSGKQCYARIRKRRNSQESKTKIANVRGSSSEGKTRPTARPISPTRGSAKRDSSSKDTTRGKGKQDDRPKYPPYYFQHDNRDKVNPPRRNTLDRRPARTRRFSADDRRDDRKRKSQSPSPRPSVKHIHESSRVVAKTSLLDRLVGSGSIPQKSGVNFESDDCSSKTANDAEVQNISNSESNQDRTSVLENLRSLDIDEEPSSKNSLGTAEACEIDVDKKDETGQLHILSPEDIPVPPTPKATSPVPEPPKEEIDVLQLRLIALKTAMMKKQNYYKRKKLLAASKKPFEPGNDSFTEFALTGIGDDEESIPTPPPPGTDSWPGPTIRDLDDPRWSDEDMVIDQESSYGDTIIEANIPASDPSLQNYVRHSTSSPSSQDKLPCCKGNPIPVVSPHRPAKEVDERRPALSTSTSVIIPVQEISPPPVPKETPKYLKEISSNLKSGMRRRRRGRQQRPYSRRNSISNRARTPAVRRSERSIHHREINRSVPIARKSRVFEGDDDEDALRQLALMSVKPKNSITGGMLAKIGKNLNPLHIETDPVALEIKPEFSARNPSPAEGWEDIDEDILRAQLLSSLSKSIPVVPSQPEIPPSLSIPVKRIVIEPKMSLRKDVLTKRLNKENLYTKRNVVVHPNNTKSSKRNNKKYINPNVKASLTPPLNPPVIEKFIIKVSESDTSEDDEKTLRGKILSDFESAVIGHQLELESSIDRLLEEARKETELIQKATPYYPMYDVGVEVLADVKEEKMSPTSCDVAKQEVKDVVPSPEVLSCPSPPEIPSECADTNRENEENIRSSQGTSHLPAWQQEEFERLKRIMAKKESVIAAAKERIRARCNLALGTAREELIVKQSNCTTYEDANKNDKTGLSHNVESEPNIFDPRQNTEEIERSCDLESVNTEIIEEKLKEDSVVPTINEDECVEKEVWSCIEFLMSIVCDETGFSGSCKIPGDVTSGVTAATDVSNLAAVSHDNKLPTKSVLTKPNESSQPSKPTADISPVVVPQVNNAKMVSHLAVPKASTNVASSTQLSSQQMKKLLSERMAEFNKVSSASSVSLAAKNPGNAVAKSTVGKSAKPAITKKRQLPVMANASQLANSLPNGVAHAAVSKSLFAVKDSSYALKGLNEMTDLVASFENGLSEYRNLNKDFIAQRKQLILIQQKVTKKRQQLLEIKDTFENKKRLLQSTISMDTSSLSPLPDTRDQPKQSSRASELLNLKFKEVCLKGQFAMMGLETASRPQAAVKMSRPAEGLSLSPRKKMKLKARAPAVKLPSVPTASPKVLKPRQSEIADSGTMHKLVVSVREKDKMDPLIPLCPYDIKGVCKDEECQYQHLKN
ncbi:hypothetical protein GE061_007251 [Apolygus lucorum]|uniref:Putative zinc-finger domain-containing protein n=1 Tax=Apolygus lucorum TaxID=248454 RepID=A0A6A4IVA7_APOLU|nr:hypothetical protein GE061_007251 [Apolygus lucorum]